MKTHINQQFREQVNDMGSIKRQLSLWIKWLKFEPITGPDVTGDVTYIARHVSLLIVTFSSVSYYLLLSIYLKLTIVQKKNK